MTSNDFSDATPDGPLSGNWRMAQIMQHYPAAHRALIEAFGIARFPGPNGPGYEPADTLAEVLDRHGADLEPVLATIHQCHAVAEELEVTVQDVAAHQGPRPPVLLDVREAAAFARAHVPGSRHIDVPLAREIIEKWPRDTPIVLVCHHGMRSLDAVASFESQGFTNIKSLRGGVDAWAAEIDPAVPRY
jgi:rhodanese-related sulfurtransferase